MNYNQSSFRIDRNDFLKGNNSYDNYPDGGVINSVVGVNAWSKPGLLANAPSLGTTVNTTLPDRGVISWGIGKGSVGMDTIAVMEHSSQDGSFCTVSNFGAIVQVGSTDTSQVYGAGFTDTVFYQSNFYTTSKTDIIKNSPLLTTRDLSYWNTTKAQPLLESFSPHPMVVYGDILFIANGNVLHQLDGATATASVFDLGTEYVITAMTVYNNMIYIAAEPYWNFAGSFHGGSKIFTWNGYSPSWIDEWDTDYRINSMYVAPSGVMYIFNNHYMGYWTGSRVQRLRSVDNQIFKHQITSTADSLFYVDGDIVVRYGNPIFGGTKKFSTYFSSNSNDFSGIISHYRNSIVITEEGGTYSSNYRIPDVDTPSSTAANTFTFNKRKFKQPVKVRGAVIDSEKLISGQSYAIKYYDDRNILKTIGTFIATDTNMINKYSWSFVSVAGHNATRSIQPVLVHTGAGHIEIVDIIYEPSEDKFNRK